MINGFEMFSYSVLLPKTKIKRFFSGPEVVIPCKLKRQCMQSDDEKLVKRQRKNTKIPCKPSVPRMQILVCFYIPCKMLNF